LNGLRNCDCFGVPGILKGEQEAGAKDDDEDDDDDARVIWLH